VSRPRRSVARTGQAPQAWRVVLAGGLLAGGLMAVLLAVGSMLGLASPAWATSQPFGLALRAEQVPRDPHGIELVATLTGPVGQTSKPGSLAGDSVSFSVHLTQFAGAPLLSLGSATTNAAGEAVLTYRPTWTGRQALVATATNTAGTALASATASFSAASAAHPFAGNVQALRPDGTIGRAVAGVLLAIVAVVWIALIAVVVRVNLGLAARRK
jgi:hypothetical protein